MVTTWNKTTYTSLLNQHIFESCDHIALHANAWREVASWEIVVTCPSSFATRLPPCGNIVCWMCQYELWSLPFSRFRLHVSTYRSSLGKVRNSSCWRKSADRSSCRQVIWEQVSRLQRPCIRNWIVNLSLIFIVISCLVISHEFVSAHVIEHITTSFNMDWVNWSDLSWLVKHKLIAKSRTA